MAQEEHIPSRSHSGSGGGVSTDRSRNVKQKKVPQRGLGVPQLEKIRLEEQRKKEALEAANANSIGSVNDAIFHSPNTLFRSSPSIPLQIIDGGVDDTNLQSGNDSWSRFWYGDCSHSMPQRSFIFHQPVVNPSTVLTSYMEPPSNQNIHGSNYASLWPEEYKMVGMKRSYPFSTESPPARSFPGYFDPSSVASKSRSDELPSCSSGYTDQREARNIHISVARDDQSNLTPLLKQSHREEVLRNDKRLNGDFLTLAPPAAALPSSNPNHSYRVDYSGFEGPEENTRNKVQEPLDLFPARSDLDEATALVTDVNRETGETIDLNLKL